MLGLLAFSALSCVSNIHVGGHIVAHLTDTRVQLRKGKGEQRIAKIEQHPMMPPADAPFSITGGGVAQAID